MTYLGSYDSFSVLVLWEVRENSWNLSTFSLLLEKQNYKNPRRFLDRVKHTNFVWILKCNTAPCRILRGMYILNSCHDLCAMSQLIHGVYVYDFLFSVKKTRVWIIAILTLKVISWGYPIHGVYRPSLSLDY